MFLFVCFFCFEIIKPNEIITRDKFCGFAQCKYFCGCIATKMSAGKTKHMYYNIKHVLELARSLYISKHY